MSNSFNPYDLEAFMHVRQHGLPVHQDGQQLADNGDGAGLSREYGAGLGRDYDLEGFTSFQGQQHGWPLRQHGQQLADDTVGTQQSGLGGEYETVSNHIYF
jgi:hypothetical protein